MRIFDDYRFLATNGLVAVDSKLMLIAGDVFLISPYGF
jgi:hypothetical protein